MVYLTRLVYHECNLVLHERLAKRARMIFWEGSYDIVFDKSVKLSELHYNVTKNDFLTETFCIVTWVLTSAFFWLQNVFFQTMSTFKPLEPQFNADQSFLGNYDLKMYGFQDIGGQIPRWRHHYSEEFFWTYINLYIVGSAIQYWAKFPWKLWSENVWFSRYRGSKSKMTSYFKRMFLFFSNVSIYISWILGRSKLF